MSTGERLAIGFCILICLLGIAGLLSLVWQDLNWMAGFGALVIFGICYILGTAFDYLDKWMRKEND